MSNKHNPHDLYFRSAMSKPEVAKDFFQQHLPTKVLQLANLDTLTLCKDSFVDDHLKSSITDMLYSVKINENTGYFYLLVEHQSTANKLMPFRMLKYTINIIERHLKKTKSKVLPLIIPMVFYHGKISYPYSLNIYDLFEEYREIASETMFHSFHLVDVTRIADEILKQRTWSGIMQFTMKHIFTREFMRFADDINQMMLNIYRQGDTDYINTSLYYLYHANRLENPSELIDNISLQLTETTGDTNMMTVAEYLHQKGHKEGHNEGRSIGCKEGMEKGLTHVAKRMLQHGMDIKVISKITGLEEDKIVPLTETNS